jgi:Stress responsive A/B Barrel Domain
MFRQVVVCQWAEGASPETKQAFRVALDGLRAIPELLAMTCGDDAGHFDDNFDFVVVADFADFAAARRYVAHPLHQAYVRDHASKAIGQRIIVQHDWIAPDVS